MEEAGEGHPQNLEACELTSNERHHGERFAIRAPSLAPLQLVVGRPSQHTDLCADRKAPCHRSTWGIESLATT